MGTPLIPALSDVAGMVRRYFRLFFMAFVVTDEQITLSTDDKNSSKGTGTLRNQFIISL